MNQMNMSPKILRGYLFSIFITIFGWGPFTHASDGGLITIQSQPKIQTIVLNGKVGAYDTRYINSSVEYLYQYTFNTSSLVSRYSGG